MMQDRRGQGLMKLSPQMLTVTSIIVVADSDVEVGSGE